MNIFFNISHPAHVHLFKNTINILKERGHSVIVGARNKEFCLKLLKSYGIDHIVLTNKGSGIFGLLKELLEQQIKITKILREHPIDLMVQMNGIFNAPVGMVFGIPTLAFSDTENDKWANLISFKLTKHVFIPTCFDPTVGGTWKNQILYPGYHELAYLSPKYFKQEIKSENRYLIRFVGWGAGHDIGETSLSKAQKIELINVLKKRGQVFISSEAPLPSELEKYRYKISPSEIHKFMAKCKIVVGESATMASEAACMGIPAIFISNTGRGYTTEQDKKFGLIKHYKLTQWKHIIHTLKLWSEKDLFEEWQKKRRKMMEDKMEVTDWIVDLIEGYPESLTTARNGEFNRFRL